MIDLALLIPLVIKSAAEASTGNGGSTQIIVAALGAGSIGAVLAAMVTGLFTKRKLGAEATEIITKAASGVVESLNAEITRVNATMAAVRSEQAEERIKHAAELHERDRREAARETAVRRTLQLHVSWDVMARAKLAEYGIDLPEPPPLLPPLPEWPTE